MASTTLNGRPRRTVPIPDSHDSTPTDLPTISLPVGGRNDHLGNSRKEVRHNEASRRVGEV